ncbi:MAG: HAD family hydrolase [Ignavibacteriales bacterium]
MKKDYEAAIFDFDYTLVDSSKAVIECISYAMNELGFPVKSAKTICKTIGLSLEETFITLAGQDANEGVQDFERFFKLKADEVMVCLTNFYEYVPGVIKFLKKKGIKLAIVSNKKRYRIEAILEKENLKDFFDLIVGSEDVSHNKPHPEGLLKAVEGLGISIDKCMYVGDSMVDAKTAESAGVEFTAVLSGETEKEEFEKAEVKRIINNLEQLPELLGY